MINDVTNPVNILQLRKHHIQVTDHYMNIGELSYEGYFWEVSQKVQKNELREANPNYFFHTQVVLEPEQQVHGRGVYGIIDLLGDLGGQIEIYLFVFGWIMFALSERSFTLKATKNLFLARTKDKNMFNKVDEKQKPEY